MLDPYRMVFVNGIASLVLIGTILFYTFIFPKKKLNLVVLLVLVSLLPLISLLRKGTYESGLLSEHVPTAMSFFEALQDGTFFPSWSARACSGYGCPAFVFHYRLPFYLSSLFHLLGFSFLSSVKLVLATSFIASGIAMYLWIREEVGKTAAFVSSVFYLYAPYHLATMHFRVSIGEVLSFVFLPLILLSIKKVSDRRDYRYFFIGALSVLLIILSHHITLYASFPIILTYTLYVTNKKNIFQKLLLSGSMLGIGVLLAAHFWVPVIFEYQYMRQYLATDINFSPLWMYLYSPFEYRFGLLFQGHHGELYPNIGYIQIITILITFLLLWKTKIKSSLKLLLSMFLALFFFYFFMTQSISKPIWEIIPFIKNAGFAWRLMIEVSFITAVIAGIVAKVVNKQWITILLCVFAIFLTILNWGNRRAIPEMDEEYFKTADIYDEAPCMAELTTPLTVDVCAPWIGTHPTTSIEILSGNGTIKEVSRSTTKHEYVVYAKDDVLLKENTYFYPGWSLHVDNSDVPIDYRHKQFKGLMLFSLPEGLHTVTFSFTDTPVRKYSKWLSLGSLFVLLAATTLLSVKKPLKNS